MAGLLSIAALAFGTMLAVAPAAGAEAAAPLGAEADGCAAFADVSAQDCEDVTWLAEQSITHGVDDSHFDPAGDVTRAQMAAFLYRMIGPSDSANCTGAPFADVDSGSPFCPAIAWLVDQGITHGVDATHYTPTAVVTRGQTAAFLYRTIGPDAAAACNTAAFADAFADIDGDTSFCGEIQWLTSRSISRGVDATHFAPSAAVTRAQMAALLHRADGTPDVAGVFSPTETFVRIPAGDHTVPGTLNVPDATGPLPVVLMLHGTASLRDEVGNMYAREAALLAADGIASLRIDFAGSGASEQPETALTYPGMVGDATAALTYLQGDSRFDPDRIAVLGFSRGSTVAATLVGAYPDIAAFASWSGAITNGTHEDPANEAIAKRDGHVVVDLGFRTWDYSYAWYTTVAAAHAFDDGKNYSGPFLAIVGSDDEEVPPTVSSDYIAAIPSTDTTLHTVDGANHIYRVLTDDQSMAKNVLATTADWFATRIGG